MTRTAWAMNGAGRPYIQDIVPNASACFVWLAMGRLIFQWPTSLFCAGDSSV